MQRVSHKPLLVFSDKNGICIYPNRDIMNFTYSFKLSEYFPHIIHLKEPDQAYIEQQIVNVRE